MEKKIYISCDMEGCAGVTSWEQTHYGQKGYEQALAEMTRETVAAVEACQAAGYAVTVKDGHEDGINLDPALLPAATELIQGWDSSPEEMMAGISADYAGAIQIGCHSPAGSSETPLDHTVEHGWYSWVKLNGELASEFAFNSLCAAQYGVPSLFMSGDAGICRRAEEFCPGIVTCATKRGVGSATVNKSPQEVASAIKTGIKQALAAPGPLPLLKDEYLLEFCFSSAGRARAASFYPGAERSGERIVRYRAKSIKELLTAKMFMTEI